jgi:hypothetical protein
MAFGISRVFKSTDANAPRFALSAGQFKNMLKAVLVDGYGTTPSLGWTLEYESGNIAVFRMKGGTRYYLRLDDNNNINGTEYANGFSAFKTMDSLNTGTERVPSLGISQFWFRKRYGGTANVPWMVIGDDAGFILLIQNQYVSNPNSIAEILWSANYFGDYVPFDVRNKWNFCILGSFNVSNSNCGLHKHGPLSTTNHVVQRDHSFKKGSAYCGITSFVYTTYFGQSSASMTGGIGTAGCKIAGTFYTSPVILYTAMLDTNILSSTCLLGIIPGIKEPYMTDGEANTVMTVSQVAPVTVTTSDYTDTLLYLHNNSGYNNQTYSNYSSKLIFRVGKGFRNV